MSEKELTDEDLQEILYNLIRMQNGLNDLEVILRNAGYEKAAQELDTAVGSIDDAQFHLPEYKKSR